MCVLPAEVTLAPYGDKTEQRGTQFCLLTLRHPDIDSQAYASAAADVDDLFLDAYASNSKQPLRVEQLYEIWYGLGIQAPSESAAG